MNVLRKTHPIVLLIVVISLCVISYHYGAWSSSSSSSSSPVPLSRKSLDMHPLQSVTDCPRCKATVVNQPDKQQLEHGEDMVFDRRLPGEDKLKDAPSVAYAAVHYLWCGNKTFRFKDYLSVLSAVKVFRPLSLVFHFTHEPQTDDYNTWFKSMMSSILGLEMRKLSSKATCGSLDMLKTVLGLLSETGGVFVGEGIVLSPVLKDQPPSRDLWFAFSNQTDTTSGVIIAKKRFSEEQKQSYFESIMATGKKQHQGCLPVERFNLSSHDQFCVAVPGTVFPRDIMYANTSFAQVARLYFYGRHGPMTPQQDTNNLIPRISHFVRFQTVNRNYKKDFPFSQYLSVLSALHVAGFHRVYIHLNEEPTGKWWKELAEERVTVVKMDTPQTVFQQRISKVQHSSDIARYQILYKYGGAYQDFDVIWTSYVPDSLLSNPFVASNDWLTQNTEFPTSFNLGVMLARPGAQWLHYYLQTYTDFRAKSWGYNSLLMSYRTYELHPHLMHLDPRLMVLCHGQICHPTWEKSYLRRSPGSKIPTMPFRWQEVRSVHTTFPKPHRSLASLAQVKQQKDMHADIARFILRQSGKKDLLI